MLLHGFSHKIQKNRDKNPGRCDRAILYHAWVSFDQLSAKYGLNIGEKAGRLQEPGNAAKKFCATSLLNIS